MSIIVKGMDMPKSCYECRFAVDGWCQVYDCYKIHTDNVPKEWVTNWCPLVEVPTPHGRLIDADEMVEKYHTGSFDIAKVAKAMPTVIEAEE